MSKDFQQSAVQGTGMALAAVILLAIVNMLASYLTAESSENDAVRINLAGSLRMQAYRITNEYILEYSNSSLGSRARLEQTAGEFERRLEIPVLADHIRNSDDPVLQDTLTAVEAGWTRLKPQLLASVSQPQRVLQQVDLFVADINNLVKMLELQTESKFRVLRLIQGFCLLLTVCLASVMFLKVYKYVVGPLNQLLTMADRLRAGDFSMRLEGKRDDELNLLADTFNDMAESLDGMYRTLEEQVQSKTRHLEETRKMLRFLYDNSRRLSEEGNIVTKIERTIDHLLREIDIERCNIVLNHLSPEHPFLIVSSPEQAPARDPSSKPATAPDQNVKSYQLQHDNRDYGRLNVTFASHENISGAQNLMLTALADTIGAALANETRKDREHWVALMEERTAIARELHDSIAQSLSFTKIQASRLQSLLAQDAGREQLESVLMEIRTGIQSAYAQLRELLTTFRLQLDATGLQASLAVTAKEFEDKGKISVTLESSLQNYPLTPNEEIHILQIVRESLSNVLRHSGADKARIQLELERNPDMIEVRVTDNGDGFGAPPPRLEHYGQAIMRERAAILGGIIEFGNAADGGAEVKLRFTAEYASSRAAAKPHQDNSIGHDL